MGEVFLEARRLSGLAGDQSPPPWAVHLVAGWRELPPQGLGRVSEFVEKGKNLLVTSIMTQQNRSFCDILYSGKTLQKSVCWL